MAFHSIMSSVFGGEQSGSVQRATDVFCLMSVVSTVDLFSSCLFLITLAPPSLFFHCAHLMAIGYSHALYNRPEPKSSLCSFVFAFFSLLQSSPFTISFRFAFSFNPFTSSSIQAGNPHKQTTKHRRQLLPTYNRKHQHTK